MANQLLFCRLGNDIFDSKKWIHRRSIFSVSLVVFHSLLHPRQAKATIA